METQGVHSAFYVFWAQGDMNRLVFKAKPTKSFSTTVNMVELMEH